MKRILFSILALVAIMSTALAVPDSAFALCTDDQLKNGCVSTAIIGDGCSCDSGNGDSIMHILGLVVDIMTIGIGILGVIGITIVGIQYLTSGSSEDKTRKAKRRMFEIILGLAAYVVIYAFLKWLLPGFNS